MGDKLRCAIIGHGYWGKILERYLRESPKVELSCIYDSVDKNESCFEKILLDDTINAFFVCTPIDTHFDIVKKALESNKHVFCEKPLSKHSRECEELARLALKKNLCLYTDYTYTVSQSIKFLKGNLASIGNILEISGEMQQFGKFYKYDSVEEVLGVHLLSIVLYLLGSEEKINVTKVEKVRTLNHRTLDCRFELTSTNAGKMHFLCSLVSDVKTRKFCIKGEKGILSFDMLGEYTARRCLFEPSSDYGYCIIADEGRAFDEKNNIQCAINEFLDEVNTGSKDNLELSLAVTKVTEKICYK